MGAARVSQARQTIDARYRSGIVSGYRATYQHGLLHPIHPRRPRRYIANHRRGHATIIFSRAEGTQHVRRSRRMYFFNIPAMSDRCKLHARRAREGLRGGASATAGSANPGERERAGGSPQWESGSGERAARDRIGSATPRESRKGGALAHTDEGYRRSREGSPPEGEKAGRRRRRKQPRSAPTTRPKQDNRANVGRRPSTASRTRLTAERRR